MYNETENNELTEETTGLEQNQTEQDNINAAIVHLLSASVLYRDAKTDKNHYNTILQNFNYVYKELKKYGILTVYDEDIAVIHTKRDTNSTYSLIKSKKYSKEKSIFLIYLMTKLIGADITVSTIFYKDDFANFYEENVSETGNKEQLKKEIESLIDFGLKSNLTKEIENEPDAYQINRFVRSIVSVQELEDYKKTLEETKNKKEEE